jgi:hypothetical protein
MSHGLTGPVALAVAAILAATAGQCLTTAVRGVGARRRLANSNHGVMAAAMGVMVAPSLLPGAGSIMVSSGMIVLFGLLAAVWAVVGASGQKCHGSVDHPAPCGTRPWHLVVMNGAMAVMLMPAAVGHTVRLAGGHSSVHASSASAAGPVVVQAAAPTSGPTIALGLCAFALSIYFVVHTVCTLTARGAPRARRLGQGAMSAAMATMLLLP